MSNLFKKGWTKFGVGSDGRELKRGTERNMTEEINNSDTATLCPTKAGNGYKIVVNGMWFYASKPQVLD